jgi:hypothetical protein
MANPDKSDALIAEFERFGAELKERIFNDALEN